VIERLLEGREDLAIGPAVAPPAPSGESALAFPGKVASDGAERIAVADTGHDRVLVCDIQGRVLQALDGFHQPQGVRFDGDHLLVCDTVAGEVVAVPVAGGRRRVIASGLRSPWDCVRLGDGRIAIAEAGSHRIVAVAADGGPAQAIAGSGAEGLRDGPALSAHMAQPSGLTRLSGDALAFAVSEVSALRVLGGGIVATLVGHGLFEWSANDGDRTAARLQHPLGVAALAGGAVAVAGTFNSLLRIWDKDALRTLRLSEPLDEPGGLDVLPDGRLLVADTNHHRVVTVEISTGAVVNIPIGRSPVEQPATIAELSGHPGAMLPVHANVDLDGADLDLAQGPPVHINLSADPPSLLGPGPRSWALDTLPIDLEVPLGSPGRGVLTVDLIAATCSGDVCTVARSTNEHPLTVA
jgi:NHL repeat